MELKPIDSAELIELVAGWLNDKNNYQWLDFGHGNQIVTAHSLKVMIQRDIHVLRIFTAAAGVPIGVVGLSNVDRNFRTATIWITLGDRQYSNQGYPTRAASQMLTLGFTEIGLHAINAWTVESNYASLRCIKRLGFCLIGRQRQCHYIDGRPYDRLLFDLLASEYKEI